MDNNTQLIVYTLEFCPNCELLKEFLSGRGIPYAERDLSSAESLTELRVNGIFVNEAPVLQNEDLFLTSEEMFSSGAVREDQIKKLIEGV
jgi:glutaredoxin